MLLSKPFLTLISGTSISKVTMLISLPILARLYSQEQIGLFNFFLSLALIISPLTNLRIPVLIPMIKSERLCKNTFDILLLFSMLASFVLSWIIILFISILASDKFYNVDITYVWILLGLLTFLVSMSELSQFFLLRRKVFYLISLAQIGGALIGESFKVLTGLYIDSYTFLLVGNMISHGALIFVCLYSVYSESRIKSDKTYNRPSMLLKMNLFHRFLRTKRSFISFRLPSQILLNLATYAPILIFTFAYDASTAAQVAFAIAVVYAPSSLVGNSISNAFYSKLVSEANVNKNNQTKVLVETIINNLLRLSVPLIIIGVTVGPQVFKFVFGEEWDLAASFVPILVCASSIQIVVLPLINVLTFKSLDKEFFQNNLYRCILVYSALLITSLFFKSPFISVSFYAIALLISYYVLYKQVMRSLG